MKRETLFLKIAVFLIGIPVLALCVWVVPRVALNTVEHSPILTIVALIGVYATAIAYFVALFTTIKLLSYIDQNIAFSELSVKALIKIKYCAILISSVYVVGMPLIYYAAEVDDAPGLILIGMVIIFASFVVAVFAAVLQKLLKNAIDIKSENDLTV
ncbi:DUF2975 domain-containing protein [Lysinibacillus sp. HST-98]|jgi:Protein of unknown function (DUF2975)|uniref:DUF2975 domain-containing protein n=1 Tax=Lysinibacillus TaxID=400634 RepID=UPI0001DA4B13|nr:MULTISPECIES: DUF2975 domain-containing protein [Lysinibacillus]EFI68713.1 hypothetical protein BFZC1_11627 [Lysinibacillus fusiformis ZC1]EKU43493.1 hypothetical protein C518_1375 [Lysinibacillus fusiformis ZB2]MBL3729961.1 DUF2975 domain-containing protein [Lysinibacillus sp. HST-98]MBU5251266.1 DUF2975 domain-containing protein [Lysinibacillus capsici]MCS5499903.1 DUF2975 domain-containing protein [Lysinibacillus sp. A4]